jgi:hypothetical protein
MLNYCPMPIAALSRELKKCIKGIKMAHHIMMRIGLGGIFK